MAAASRRCDNVPSAEPFRVAADALALIAVALLARRCRG
jgi:hypothetical protein